ncbi:hypothetical protein [Parvularcula dongshanensis]|uniref:Uncharacterized protein n=1 Tax=Parvularcula dongshanensis TaxID=1173995 RepID=A0A840I0S9_9PROT|nr:hypothetical protein [Parvularcula dongshanensis]MBB4657798.1 hypothetical protein [Parvularcula dongshanensis]
MTTLKRRDYIFRPKPRRARSAVLFVMLAAAGTLGAAAVTATEAGDLQAMAAAVAQLG